MPPDHPVPDIAAQYVELARRGQEEGDFNARRDLLFHPDFCALVCSSLRMLHGRPSLAPSFGDYFAIVGGDPYDSRSIESMAIDLLLWVLEFRFQSIYATATAFQSWEGFSKVFTGGRTIMNLLRDFFGARLKNLRGDKGLRRYHEPMPSARMAKTGVDPEEIEAARDGVVGEEADEEAEHDRGDRFCRALVDWFEHAKDRELACALALHTEPLTHFLECNAGRLCRLFPKAPQSFEQSVKDLGKAYDRGVAEKNRLAAEHYGLAERLRAELGEVHARNGEKTEDTANRETRCAAEVDLFVRSSAEAARAKFVSETTIAETLGLRDAQAGRNLLKRAKRELNRIAAGLRDDGVA